MEFAAIRDVSLPVLIPISDSCMGILSRPVEFLFELPEDDSSLRWARGLDHIVFADNNIASAPARTGDAKTQPIPAAPRMSAPAQQGARR